MNFRFRVLLKRKRAILFSVLSGIAFIVLSTVNFYVSSRDFLWAGIMVLVWSGFSLVARVLRSEKVYSPWIQIPILLLILFMSLIVIGIILEVKFPME